MMRHPREVGTAENGFGLWSLLLPASEPRRRKSRNRTAPTLLQLETRQLLSADLSSLSTGGMESLYQDPKTGEVFELDAAPPLPADLAAGAAAADTAAASSGPLYPLSSVPVLNSLPGAAASIYLDFVGDYEASWGSYTRISTPAYDSDGDPTTFSNSELAAIQKIWSYVAEDYSPFQINVTTVAPPSFDNGVALKMVIGGTGSWMGAVYGGISYVGSFSNDMPNVSFVFAKNLGNGNARYTADATSHEAGHDFGLSHQSSYSGTTLTQEYSTGPGNGTAPLMGNSYYAGRSLWWDGTSDLSSATYQDDMSVIAGAANGFGYRPESAGTTAATATMISTTGAQVSASGVILNGQDVNFYTVLADAGAATFTVQAAVGYNNLVPTIQLYDSTGTILLASVTTPSIGSSATISVTFNQAGSYRLVVRSDGTYGNAGQYSVSGTIVPAPPWLHVDMPTNPTTTATDASQIVTISTGNFAVPTVVTGPPATISGLVVVGRSNNSVTLSWSDSSGTASGYQIQRSVNGGKKWVTIASVDGDSNAFTDRSVKASKRYLYRVVSFNSQGSSSPSGPVAVTTPKFSASRFSHTAKAVRSAKFAARVKHSSVAKAAPSTSTQPSQLAPGSVVLGPLPIQAAQAIGVRVNWTPVIA